MEVSCREALGSVAELSGTEAVRWGPDHRTSPTLMADLQLQQQDPVFRPVLAASTAKLPDTKERSTRALCAAVPSTVPEEWDLPSWAG